jgi:hypothetical protein
MRVGWVWEERQLENSEDKRDRVILDKGAINGN